MVCVLVLRGGIKHSTPYLVGGGFWLAVVIYILYRVFTDPIASHDLRSIVAVIFVSLLLIPVCIYAMSRGLRGLYLDYLISLFARKCSISSMGISFDKPYLVEYGLLEVEAKHVGYRKIYEVMTYFTSLSPRVIEIRHASFDDLSKLNLSDYSLVVDGFYEGRLEVPCIKVRVGSREFYVLVLRRFSMKERRVDLNLDFDDDSFFAEVRLSRDKIVGSLSRRRVDGTGKATLYLIGCLGRYEVKIPLATLESKQSSVSFSHEIMLEDDVVVFTHKDALELSSLGVFADLLGVKAPIVLGNVSYKVRLEVRKGLRKKSIEKEL